MVAKKKQVSRRSCAQHERCGVFCITHLLGVDRGVEYVTQDQCLEVRSSDELENPYLVRE